MKLLDAWKSTRIIKKEGMTGGLSTPWTDQVTEENVWQEYPRPQMMRKTWQNLNGLWSYAIREDEEHPDAWDGEILVPFSPEAPLSGVNRQLKPGETLWYGRAFTVEEKEEEGHALLHFGAVDQRCKVWINGYLAGSHEGGYLPFTLDISTYLQKGNNNIVVSCQDDSDTSYHARGKQMLRRGGMFYTAQSGIWQTVWLEQVPKLYIEKLMLTPLPDKKQVLVKILLGGEADQTAVICRVTATVSGGKRVADRMGKPGQIRLSIPEPVLWSPETPYLYGLEVVLFAQDAQNKKSEPLATDQVSSYFAMRTVSMEEDEEGVLRLCLNHQPYFRNGVLDQGYWPDGLMTAPCEEAMIFDILQMKKCGFNMLRKHCKIEPLRWYYHCDRLGMLVWQDMVNGGSTYDMMQICYLPTLFPSRGEGHRIRSGATGRKENRGRKEWYKECEETITLLQNHPCVEAWTLFNEGWGQFEPKKTCEFARSLDPSRLIDAASGWFDLGQGDMKSVHNYFRKLKCPKDPMGEKRGIHRSKVISEYGGVAWPVPGHVATAQTYGYKTLKTGRAWKKKAGSLWNQIKDLEKEGLSAAVYTQVSDIEDEVNGILTYDRKKNKWEED